MEAALVPQVPVSTDTGSNSQRDAGIYETHQKAHRANLNLSTSPARFPTALLWTRLFLFPLKLTIRGAHRQTVGRVLV